MPVVAIAGGAATAVGQRSVRPSAILTFEIPTFTGSARSIRLRLSTDDGKRGRVGINWGTLGHPNASGSNEIIYADGLQEAGGAYRNTFELHENFQRDVAASESGATYVIKLYGQFSHLRFYTDPYLKQWLTKAELGPARMTSGSFVFSNCENLKSVKIARDSFDAPTSFRRMFYKCFALGDSGAEVDIDQLSTSRATSMSQMFFACAKLKETTVNLNRWNLQKMVVMAGMFSGCGSNLDILIYNWRLPKARNTASFLRNSGLKVGLLTKIYISWAASYLEDDANRDDIPSIVDLNWGYSTFGFEGATPRATLITNNQWSFTDAGLVPE